MVAKINTVSFIGVSTAAVNVEVHIGNGLPFFTIVGLPDKNISEAKERIRAAFNVIGLSLPAKRITVNMSPANLPKEGSHYDLPIALGILVAMEIIPQSFVDQWLVIGELSLDGSIQNTRGALLAAIYANSKEYTLVAPVSSSVEIKLSGILNVLLFQNLLEIISFKQGCASYILDDVEIPYQENTYEFDMSDVKGQYTAKRVLEIAAVFRLHVLMIGSPGVGKSMLAKRLITILPPLSASDLLEVNMVYSVAANEQVAPCRIPYRSPHYSTTVAALVGGGVKASPGEVTLSHKGVLFLDELGEYSKALESLRQCLEDKKVTIARANFHITYPADFQLIAAMNPCKCGYYNTIKQCKKIPVCKDQYMSRISGPMLERFDCVIFLDQEEVYSNSGVNERSQDIQKRIIQARELYNTLYDKKIEDLLFEDIKIDEKAKDFLNEYCQKKMLSKRVYIKLLKVALAISLLAKKDRIEYKHVAESVMYRRL